MMSPAPPPIGTLSSAPAAGAAAAGIAAANRPNSAIRTGNPYRIRRPDDLMSSSPSHSGRISPPVGHAYAILIKIHTGHFCHSAIDWVTTPPGQTRRSPGAADVAT
ncbi:hypothetical protein Isolate57596_04060 [Mycobacteroides abscessus subsp. abscessus]